MKVGDLVIRKKRNVFATPRISTDLGPGIVLSKQVGGRNPEHLCITVLYPKTGQKYDIAESLVEVISESR